MDNMSSAHQEATFQTFDSAWLDSSLALDHIDELPSLDSGFEFVRTSGQHDTPSYESHPRMGLSPWRFPLLQGTQSSALIPSRRPEWPSTLYPSSETDHHRTLSMNIGADSNSISPRYSLTAPGDAVPTLVRQEMLPRLSDTVPRSFTNAMSTYGMSHDPAPEQDAQWYGEESYVSANVLSYRDFLPPVDSQNEAADHQFDISSSFKLEAGVLSPPLTCDPVACDDDQMSHTMAARSRVGSQVVAEEDVGSDQPYAKLIHKAMMKAPGHRMTLRQIYDWFRDNTTKAKEPGSKGWQNSIRHNLSMNQAFESEKTPQQHGQSKKSSNVWVLTKEAVATGVQSTTRYRKAGINKKPCKSRTPQQRRQLAGAKGGRAARRAAILKSKQQQAAQTDAQTPLQGSENGFLDDTSDMMSTAIPEYRQFARQSSPPSLTEAASYVVFDDEYPLFGAEGLQLTQMNEEDDFNFDRLESSVNRESSLS